jgi:hypothetical protein
MLVCRFTFEALDKSADIGRNVVCIFARDFYFTPELSLGPAQSRTEEITYQLHDPIGDP